MGDYLQHSTLIKGSSLVHTKPLHIKKTDNTKKPRRDVNVYFTENKIQMAYEHKKRYSTRLALR